MRCHDHDGQRSEGLKNCVRATEKRPVNTLTVTEPAESAPEKGGKEQRIMMWLSRLSTPIE